MKILAYKFKSVQVNEFESEQKQLKDAEAITVEHIDEKITIVE
jgi:hypothetical protein